MDRLGNAIGGADPVTGQLLSPEERIAQGAQGLGAGMLTVAGAWAGTRAAVGALDTITAPTAGRTVSEGIYEFTASSERQYVGQSGNMPNRINQHLSTGKLLQRDISTVRTTEVLGGKTQREVAEQLRINELGGVRNLENTRNPIGPNRQHLLPPKPRDE